MGSRAPSGTKEETQQEQLSGTVRRKPVPSSKSYGSWFLLFLNFLSLSYITKETWRANDVCCCAGTTDETRCGVWRTGDQLSHRRSGRSAEGL